MSFMKRLIVMRHAKSDWNAGAETDHSRPLNKRGRYDAPRIGEKLTDLGWTPQHVLSSDAQRTRETFELMAVAWTPQPDVEFLDTLYHAGPDHLPDLISGLTDSVEIAMLLGHNPGWEQVVQWLSRETVRMTTANAALIDCDATTWSDVVRHAGNWTLTDLLRPKEI